MSLGSSFRASRALHWACRRRKEGAARPGIHAPEWWLRIPGSRAISAFTRVFDALWLAPRNDKTEGLARVGCVVFGAFLLLAFPARAGDPTPEEVDQGRQLYDDDCASCHGRDMVTSGVAAFDLRKFPKDDAARFRKSVRDGKGGMPAWRERLSDDDLNLLWAYVRSGG